VELREYHDSPLVKFLHRDGNRENQEHAVLMLLQLIDLGYSNESVRPHFVQFFMDTLTDIEEDSPETLLTYLYQHIQKKQREYEERQARNA